MSNINEKEEKDSAGSAGRIDINSPHDRVVEKFLQESETARSEQPGEFNG